MDVTVIGSGANSNVEIQVDPTYQAIRANLRPTEWQSPAGVIGGHYHTSALTGTIAAAIASAAQVFQVRWGDPSKLFILKKLTVQCNTLTAFTTGTGGVPLELILGHGSTANGSGGTSLGITGSSNRLRTSMAGSAFATSGEVRVATTAALTAATGQTLEAVALANCLGPANATNAQTPVMALFEMRDAGAHPLILNSGDTFAVRTNTVAAAGTWVAAFTMEWVESVAY